jgi:hypothetical protein
MEYVPEVKSTPVLKKPTTYIQELFVDVMNVIVEDLGEVMPHEHDKHPKDKNIKLLRVYIPSRLATNILDLVRLLVSKDLLPNDINEGTMQ